MKLQAARRDRFCASMAAFIAVLIIAIGLTTPGVAFARAIDDIRLSRVASVTTTEIELGCAMRYLDHALSGGGTELRIRLVLGFDCVGALRSAPSSLHRPRGGRMAYLSSVEFNTLDVGRAAISLHFERPVSAHVTQTANEYLLIIETEADSQSITVASDTHAAELPSPAAPPAIQKPVNRGTSRAVRRAQPQVRDRFALRLAGLASVSEAGWESLRRIERKILYTQRIVLKGREWNELQLGFYETEAGASNALSELQPAFPDAWITVAPPDEQARAATQRLQLGEDGLPDSVSSNQAPVVAAAAQAALLPAERVDALMADAKAAIVRGNFDSSIEIYRQVLRQPVGSHRPTAREFLGVAYQKNGQPALAAAEFELYLSEFPNEAGARRVQQRLASLAGTGTPDTPKTPRATPQPLAGREACARRRGR